MEITDRWDVGDDLYAPQSDGSGNEQWSYTLVTEAQPGDIVLHWHKSRLGRPAIIGWSEVTGPLSIGSITWQARGTRGRARGVATTGPSWRMQCGGLNELRTPVTSDDLNHQEPSIKGVHAALQAKFSGSLYFPFIFYRPGQLRANQAYLTKFPADLAALFPQLATLLNPRKGGTVPRSTVKKAVGTPRTQDPVLRAAIERWAVGQAKAHYLKLGATKIEELGKPFDLVVHGLGPERHVEVKGSSVEALAVELTANEVTHARNYAHTDLVVVDRIRWTRDAGGAYTTSGGNLRIWSSWRPEDEYLSTTRFRYELGEQD
jgi:hypothetical protein